MKFMKRSILEIKFSIGGNLPTDISGTFKNMQFKTVKELLTD